MEETTKTGRLILLPNLLGEEGDVGTLPRDLEQVVAGLDGLIAESVGAGRRFLGRFKLPRPAHLVPLALLNEHSKNSDLEFLLEPVVEGQKWGLVSDAGLPCIADPGSRLIAKARQLDCSVEAWPGPCSIMIALMLSGLSGQSFTFHGYVCKESSERKHQIQQWEREAASKEKTTQILMEAPYRNDSLLKELLEFLQEDTKLCVAWDLTLPTQGVICQSVKRWKGAVLPVLKGSPALFLFAKGN